MRIANIIFVLTVIYPLSIIFSVYFFIYLQSILLFEGAILVLVRLHRRITTNNSDACPFASQDFIYEEELKAAESADLVSKSIFCLTHILHLSCSNLSLMTWQHSKDNMRQEHKASWVAASYVSSLTDSLSSHWQVSLRLAFSRDPVDEVDAISMLASALKDPSYPWWPNPDSPGNPKTAENVLAFRRINEASPHKVRGLIGLMSLCILLVSCG